MLLITMHEWLGPQARYRSEIKGFEPSERTIAFATELPAQEALQRIRQYCQAYKQKYRLAVEFRLLSVSEIQAVDADLLSYFDANLVEKLSQRPEDFE